MGIAESRQTSQYKVLSYDSGVSQRRIERTAFNGIWTKDGLCFPVSKARTGFVSATIGSKLYYGYGVEGGRVPKTDIWELDMDTMRWREIIPKKRVSILGGLITTVDGKIAVLDRGVLYIISPIDGCVEMHKTGLGSVVSLAALDGEIYIVAASDTFVVYRFSNMTHKDTKVAVKPLIGSFQYNGKLFLFTVLKTFIIIDLKTLSVTKKKPTGCIPPYAPDCGTFLVLGNYAFFLDSPKSYEYSALYCLDIDRMWFFYFFLVPDGVTTSIADGIITDSNIFMIPKQKAATITYSPKNRELIMLSGTPELNRISIGEALAFINLRDDMRNLHI